MSTNQLFSEAFVPFIGRTNELAEATHRLDQMLSGLDVADCVLFIYGVPSVGKTTLLSAIQREASKRNIPSALINFDKEARCANNTILDNHYDGSTGLVHLAQDLLDELARTGDLLPTSPILSEQIDPSDASKKFLDYSRTLYRFTQNHPFLLIFDTIEDSDPNTILWLQSEVIEKFVNEFHTLVVFASRTSPNTTRRDLIYPLERRAKVIHLLPFNESDTELQIEKIGAKDILPLPVRDIYKYTGGLPGLNDSAIRRLADRHPIESLLPFLVDIVFERLAHRVREKEEKDLKPEILSVSPLRQFDSGLLSRIVNLLWPNKYAEGSFKQIRELVSDLQETRLVGGHPDGYGYVIPSELRVVLDYYWQQIQLEKHFQVHKIAAQWFLEQVKAGDFVAIADRIYHLGGLQRDIQKNPNLSHHLESELLPNPAAIDLLKTELKEVLDALQKKNEQSKRSFDYVNQILRILNQPEFSVIFEFAPSTLEQLKLLCQNFKAKL